MANLAGHYGGQMGQYQIQWPANPFQNLPRKATNSNGNRILTKNFIEIDLKREKWSSPRSCGSDIFTRATLNHEAESPHMEKSLDKRKKATNNSSSSSLGNAPSEFKWQPATPSCLWDAVYFCTAGFAATSSDEQRWKLCAKTTNWWANL